MKITIPNNCLICANDNAHKEGFHTGSRLVEMLNFNLKINASLVETHRVNEPFETVLINFLSWFKEPQEYLDILEKAEKEKEYKIISPLSVFYLTHDFFKQFKSHESPVILLGHIPIFSDDNGLHLINLTRSPKFFDHDIGWTINTAPADVPIFGKNIYFLFQKK